MPLVVDASVVVSWMLPDKDIRRLTALESK
jgi:hypothetical protein